MCNEVNGWPNYPTWNYSLWGGVLDDDELSEIVNRCDDVYEVSKEIEERFEQWLEEYYPVLIEASMISDLFGFATGKIDWYRLAEHYWEEFREEDVDEEDEGDEEE